MIQIRLFIKIDAFKPLWMVKTYCGLKLFKKYKKSHKQFVGLKFFNVYGPNEYHKNEMKSIVLQTFEK